MNASAARCRASDARLRFSRFNSSALHVTAVLGRTTNAKDFMAACRLTPTDVAALAGGPLSTKALVGWTCGRAVRRSGGRRLSRGKWGGTAVPRLVGGRRPVHILRTGANRLPKAAPLCRLGDGTSAAEYNASLRRLRPLEGDRLQDTTRCATVARRTVTQARNACSSQLHLCLHSSVRRLLLRLLPAVLRMLRAVLRGESLMCLRGCICLPFPLPGRSRSAEFPQSALAVRRATPITMLCNSQSPAPLSKLHILGSMARNAPCSRKDLRASSGRRRLRTLV